MLSLLLHKIINASPMSTQLLFLSVQYRDLTTQLCSANPEKEQESLRFGGKGRIEILQHVEEEEILVQLGQLMAIEKLRLLTLGVLRLEVVSRIAYQQN